MVTAGQLSSDRTGHLVAQKGPPDTASWACLGQDEGGCWARRWAEPVCWPMTAPGGQEAPGPAELSLLKHSLPSPPRQSSPLPGRSCPAVPGPRLIWTSSRQREPLSKCPLCPANWAGPLPGGGRQELHVPWVGHSTGSTHWTHLSPAKEGLLDAPF